jgi:short-subunit dehydrogenase
MKIVITGASSGLGAEMARQFAALGHDLVLTARRVDRLEMLRDEIATAHPGRRIDIAALDVQDQDSVFEVFRQHAPFDRVVVNADLGSAVAVGTGGEVHNRQIALTNFVAAVSQIEAAMQEFRAQRRGHLVVISSFAAVRALSGSPAVYAATKRGIAHLAEGVRAENFGTDIDVTVVYPGWIRSEMTTTRGDAPFMVDTEPGVRSMVKGIEARRARVYAPSLPWTPLSVVLRLLPLRIVSYITAPSASTRTRKV